MQLTLPFEEKQPLPRLSIWVLACLEKPADWLARSLERFRHVILSAQDGSNAVDSADMIVLRDRATGACRVFSPCAVSDETAMSVSGDALDQLAQLNSDTVIEPLMAVFLGHEGREVTYPARDATHLERIVRTLRHKISEDAPYTRLCRSEETRAALARNGGNRTLVALLDAEAADAARSFYDAELATEKDLDATYAFHRRAAQELRGVGLSRHATRVEQSFRSWIAKSEPTFELPEFDRSTKSSRIAYLATPLVGYRMPLRLVRAKSRRDAMPTRRSCGESLRVGDKTLCAWLGQTSSPDVTAWHEWEPCGTTRNVLRIGVDTRLSIELGLAGRTGSKQQRFRVRIHGQGCDVQPMAATLDVGSFVEVEVTNAVTRESVVETVFYDGCDRRFSHRAEVPFHAHLSSGGRRQYS